MVQLDNFHKENISTNGKLSRTLYGTYEVKDSASFFLPNNTITLERVANDKFLYKRASQTETIEKLLTIRTTNLELEIVPTLPLFIPSYKTDFVFLKFEKPVFVSRDSRTDIFVSVPVEIGLFFTGNEIREYFDVFACEPPASRYALYGTPDTGKLCKFASVVPNPKEAQAHSYTEGNLRIIIQNELDTGISVGKIVFPVRDHDLYFHNDDAVYDDVKFIAKERLGVQIAEIVQQNIMLTNEWSVSPRTMEKTDIKFEMAMGFD